MKRKNQEIIFHHPEIDNQHLELLTVATDLKEALSNKDITEAKEKFGGFLELLLQHFEAEEQLMSVIAYPKKKLDRHKKAHQEFTQNYAAPGEPPVTAEELSSLVNDLFTGHFLIEDKKLAAFIKRNGHHPRD